MTHRILIMAGGTGGHVFPGLVLAKRFKDSNIEVEWLGTQSGIESRLVEAESIPLNTLSISGFRGKKVADRLKVPGRLLDSVLQARKIIKRFKPSLVLGFGGYVAAPGGLAAKLSGCPLVIHEQNAVAGTTNRMLSRFAARILVGFPTNLPDCQYVGNPIRQELISVKPPETRLSLSDDGLNILVIGGSLGASILNETVPKSLKRLGNLEKIRVVHQCGEKHIEATQNFYERQKAKATIIPFIDDMAAELARADLVICRAGALTVSEISAVGVPAIFVPYPHAIDDHQTKNAQWLSKSGAAILCPQTEFDARYLSDKIKQFLLDKEALMVMAKQARKLGKRDAVETIFNACMECLDEH